MAQVKKKSTKTKTEQTKENDSIFFCFLVDNLMIILTVPSCIFSVGIHLQLGSPKDQ